MLLVLLAKDNYFMIQGYQDIARSFELFVKRADMHYVFVFFRGLNPDLYICTDQNAMMSLDYQTFLPKERKIQE